jgi:hypothetical protein
MKWSAFKSLKGSFAFDPWIFRDELFDELKTVLMERAHDKEASIRTQVAIALSKFQVCCILINLQMIMGSSECR